jgi:hypothetical protein
MAMKKGPGLLIMAVCLMLLAVGSLAIFMLIHFNTGLMDTSWSVPLIAAVTLCLIGWVLYRARKQFL